ncbi:ankyrin repeat domain-containing protein, partial [bacterium]|nr:ankyrin repeat domain-containing protein [bacterium]
RFVTARKHVLCWAIVHQTQQIQLSPVLLLTLLAVVVTLPLLDAHRYFLLDRLGLTRFVHTAILEDKASIMDYVTKGGNPDLPGYYGQSLIYVAIQERDLEELQQLLAYGVNLQITDDNGRTPLHAAVMSSPEVLQAILSFNQIDMNARDHQGMTPLHLAVQRAPETLKLFLQHQQIQLNAKDNEGNTPAHYLTSEANAQTLVDYLQTDRVTQTQRQEMINAVLAHVLTQKWTQFAVNLKTRFLESNGVTWEAIAS